MSSSLSHASSMSFLVSVERAKLHARFKMWEKHAFMQVHNGILCFVFQFISQEFLPCSLRSWWLLNTKVTFSWVCLSYPKGITLEWHWSVQSPSFYMWRWRYFFSPCTLLYICLDGSSCAIYLPSHSSWKILLQLSTVSSHPFFRLSWYFQHFIHSNPFTEFDPFSSWALLHTD